MNNIRIPFYLFISIILFSTGCSKTKNITSDKPYELKHWLSIEKFPCFGHCKVYRMSLYRNGLVILEGKEHLEKTGVHFTELTEDKMRSFKKLADHIKWTSFKNEYMVNIPDLPITELQYYDDYGAKVKHVKANSNLPASLHHISEALNDLIASEKWTQIQRKNDMNNPEVISNEVIIDMDSTITAASLQNEFSLYDFKPINKISAFMNLWSFQFDDQKIGKYEMIVLLRKKNGIRSVNFNRKLEQR